LHHYAHNGIIQSSKASNTPEALAGMVEAIGTDSEGRQRATNYKLIDLHQAGEQERNMTNNMIIFYESQELAEAGIIDYTGRTIIVELPDGSKMEAKETEAIHTFQEWKRAGFMVQKGQKAIAKIAIWNFTDKASKATKAAREAAGADTEKPDPHYYMKESAFFKASQVAPIEA